MLKPLLDRVLVRRLEDESKPLLEVPDIARERSNKGKVLAVGDMVVLSGQIFPVEKFVKLGDTVLFSEYNWQPVKLDGEELVLLRVADILGVEQACGRSVESSDSSALTTSVPA